MTDELDTRLKELESERDYLAKKKKVLDLEGEIKKLRREVSPLNRLFKKLKENKYAKIQKI